MEADQREVHRAFDMTRGELFWAAKIEDEDGLDVVRLRRSGVVVVCLALLLPASVRMHLQELRQLSRFEPLKHLAPAAQQLLRADRPHLADSVASIKARLHIVILPALRDPPFRSLCT